jgi:hypothetical protein
MATLAEQIAALQQRANAEAQALVDADRVANAKNNLTGGKLTDEVLAKKFEDVQNSINLSGPHPAIYHLLELIKHCLAVVAEHTVALTPKDEPPVG